jgi:hypothetical protein
MSPLVTAIVILTACIATMMLFYIESWRWSIAALAVQYLIVFILVSQIWPIGLAAIKLVAGWIVCAVLTLSRRNADSQESDYSGLSVRAFRILAGVLIILVIFLITPIINSWIPAPQPFLIVGLILFSMGLIHIGISLQPLKTILGLLTLLSGFETLYSSLEGSALLAGFLASITLALGIVGSYLSGILSGNVEK